MRMLLCWLMLSPTLGNAACDIYIEQVIKSEKKDIGTQTVCFDNQEKTKQVKADLKIRWAFFTYTLQSVDSYQYSEFGLQRIISDIKEDSKNYTLDFAKVNNGFQLKTQLKNKSEEKNFSRDAFDFDSEAAVVNFLQSKKATHEYRMLDTDEYKIVQVEMEREGSASLTIGGRNYPVEKVTARGKEFTKTEWLYEQGGRYWVLKEEGKDQDGEYSVETRLLRL